MSLEIEQINTSKDFEVDRSINNSFVKKLNPPIDTSTNNEQSIDNTNNLREGDSNLINFKDSLSSFSSISIAKELEEKIKLLTSENDDLKKKLELSNSKIKEKEELIEKKDKEIKSLKSNEAHLNSDSELLSLSLEKKYSGNDLDLHNKTLKNMSFNKHNRLHSLNYSEGNFMKFKTQQIKSSAKLDFINKKLKNNITSKKSINSKENKDEIKKEEDILREEVKKLCYKSIKDFRKNNNIPENITNEEIKFALKTNNFDNEKASTYLLNK